jgi:hypothetical protein
MAAESPHGRRDLPIPQHHALWPAGGAGGVDHPPRPAPPRYTMSGPGGGRVGRDGPRPAANAAAHRLYPRIDDDVGDLRGAEEMRQRDQPPTRQRHRRIRDRIGDAGRQRDADHRVGARPRAGQQPQHAGMEPGAGGAVVAAGERHAIRAGGGVARQRAEHGRHARGSAGAAAMAAPAIIAARVAAGARRAAWARRAQAMVTTSLTLRASAATPDRADNSS